MAKATNSLCANNTLDCTMIARNYGESGNTKYGHLELFKYVLNHLILQKFTHDFHSYSGNSNAKKYFQTVANQLQHFSSNFLLLFGLL